MQNILITGIGSRLGESLAKEYLANGDAVYAIGRTLPEIFDSNPHFFFSPYDLSQTFMLKAEIKPFIQNRSFDIAILNAGMLGEIQRLDQTDLEDIKYDVQ